TNPPAPGRALQRKPRRPCEKAGVMSHATWNTVLCYLRTAAALRDAADEAGDPLERFITRRDEGAFALLLQQHGPMGLAVCRRILGESHDAEDAFQATFLVLDRRAASIGKRQALASWLHGDALRTQATRRAGAATRRTQ